MDKEQPDLTDERWGGYVPWFLRHQDFPGQGNFSKFFERLSQRLERLFQFNEAGVPNLEYFCSCLETESSQVFRYQINYKNLTPPYKQVADFFSSTTIENETVKRYFDELKASPGLAIGKTLEAAKDKQSKNWQLHYHHIVRERISVLEALLRIMPPDKPEITSQLIRDSKCFFAEAGIMLDIKGNPPLIVPMEEPLLQKETIDKLLPRLESRFPERAEELVRAYHKLIAGKDLDGVFIEAFKTLEEIARTLTKDKSFKFDNKNLKKYFPDLHSTIHETIIRLAGHRGDEGAHGRSAPGHHEIRYLLFSICNVALLLMDYPKSETS